MNSCGLKEKLIYLACQYVLVPLIGLTAAVLWGWVFVIGCRIIVAVGSWQP